MDIIFAFAARIERDMARFLRHAEAEGMNVAALNGDITLSVRDGKLATIQLPNTPVMDVGAGVGIAGIIKDIPPGTHTFRQSVEPTVILTQPGNFEAAKASIESTSDEPPVDENPYIADEIKQQFDNPAEEDEEVVPGVGKLDVGRYTKRRRDTDD